MLTKLELSQFRIFDSLCIQPNSHINMIYGENGSGKTSILEAVHLCAMGRSFRTTTLDHIIRHNAKSFTAHAELAEPALSPVTIHRTQDAKSSYAIGHSVVRKTSELSSNLPVQLFDRDTLNIVRATPETRRKYIDRGTFYQNKDILKHSKTFSEAMSQRNQLLKSRAPLSTLDPWNQIMMQSSDALTHMRQLWVAHMNQQLAIILAKLQPNSGVAEKFAHATVSLTPGYDLTTPYTEQLDACITRDLALNRTTIGPHRADFSVTLQPPYQQNSLSAGEAKALGCIVLIAQLQSIMQLTSTAPVCLIDDLGSELDINTMQTLLHYIEELGQLQIFFTGLKEKVIHSSLWPAGAHIQQFDLENIA